MTHANAENLDLQDAIRKLLSDRFREVRILSVSIEEDAFRGDGVIEINVVFSGTRDELVRGQPAGLYGIVRDKVADFRRQGAPSPVFNFISSDAHA